jgi:plastocyanin
MHKFGIRVGLRLLAAATLLLAACAPSSAGNTAPAPTVSSAAPKPTAAAAASPSAAASTSQQFTVQLTDSLKFDPATLTVPRGTTVTWRNTSQVAHTVTDDPSKAANAADAQLPSGVQPWDSGNLNPGQTFTHTFDVPGTYKYFCQPHEAAGMVATVTVSP